MKTIKILSFLGLAIFTIYSTAAQSSDLAMIDSELTANESVEKSQPNDVANKANYPTLHKTIEVNGVDIFYREAGPKDAPTILLLHGYPTSSHMFRNLIKDLSGEFHLIAPDYPGYGKNGMCRSKIIPRYDPFEWYNLAIDAAYSDLKGDLRNRLDVILTNHSAYVF